jgi:hypothetical protein
MALETASARARRQRPARLARAYVLRVLRGRAAAPHLARRRRDPDLFGHPPLPRGSSGNCGLGAHGANHRRRRDAPARRPRTRPRLRFGGDGALPLDRADARHVHSRRRRRFLLTADAAPARKASSAPTPSPRRGGSPHPLQRPARLPRPQRSSRRSDHHQHSGSGDADPRHLARGQIGRRRRLAEAVLRLRPHSLPRHARPVHDQRLRRPRGDVRELSRAARRRSRPGVRDRFSLLPAFTRRLASRRRDRRSRARPKAAKDFAAANRIRRR